MDYEQYPKTRSEAKALGAKYYYTGEPCKHGHIALRKTKGACIECLKIWWKESADKRLDYFREYGASEAGKKSKRKYYEENKEAVIARANARPAEERKLNKKKHKLANADYYKSLTSLRRRRHKNATPAWVGKEEKLAIRELYLSAMQLTRLTGEKYVVDHVIPLNNPNVCGLHTLNNLRVITQEENLKKSNKHLDLDATV